MCPKRPTRGSGSSCRRRANRRHQLTRATRIWPISVAAIDDTDYRALNSPAVSATGKGMCHTDCDHGSSGRHYRRFLLPQGLHQARICVQMRVDEFRRCNGGPLVELSAIRNGVYIPPDFGMPQVIQQSASVSQVRGRLNNLHLRSWFLCSIENTFA
jgi:hypothetical protein